MFNEKYLQYLSDLIISFTPQGYKSVVVEEMSFANAMMEDDFSLVFIVRFGPASKMRSRALNVNQPITITAISEGGSVKVINTILQQLFMYLNEDEFETVVDEKAVEVINSFSTPTPISAPMVVNGINRTLILMTGVATYRAERFTKKVWINGIVIDNLISDTTSYTSNFKTPNYIENNDVSVLVEGENNIFNLTFPLIDNDMIVQLLSIANTSNSDYGIKDFELMFEYMSTVRSFEYITSTTLVSVDVSTDYTTGETIVNARFVRNTDD